MAKQMPSIHGRNSSVPTNPHGIVQSSADEWGKRMGVPAAWVKGPSEVEFSGSVAGFVGEKGSGKLALTAESTGGGETDSHMIDFSHPHMDSNSKYAFDKFFGVDSKNPSAGKKWTATGKFGPAGLRADSGMRMNWNLAPKASE